MSLENLLKIGQHRAHPVDAEEIERVTDDVLAWRRAHHPNLTLKPS